MDYRYGVDIVNYTYLCMTFGYYKYYCDCGSGLSCGPGVVNVCSCHGYQAIPNGEWLLWNTFITVPVTFIINGFWVLVLCTTGANTFVLGSGCYELSLHFFEFRVFSGRITEIGWK